MATAGRRPEGLGLSVEEVADLLGISRDLAYDLVRRRELPGVRLGLRVVVPRRALGARPGKAQTRLRPVLRA